MVCSRPKNLCLLMLLYGLLQPIVPFQLFLLIQNNLNLNKLSPADLNWYLLLNFHVPFFDRMFWLLILDQRFPISFSLSYPLLKASHLWVPLLSHSHPHPYLHAKIIILVNNIFMVIATFWEFQFSTTDSFWHTINN